MSSGLLLTWVDVFTDRPYGGNRLAVVPDGDGLDTNAMQALATELGLSETVFVLGGAERLRIFTPAVELPLAGHPVVGTTHELARLGRIPAAGEHVFQTGSGPVPVAVEDGIATMTQGAFDPGSELDAAEIGRLLGAEVVGTPRVCSTTGIRQALARVANRATLAALAPDIAGIAELEAADGVLAWCEADGGELAQRFFAPRMGIAEDPGTGSAAGALGALRVYEGAEPGRKTVRQGEEVGRPCEIHVEVGGSPGEPEDVRVGGRAVLVLEARLALDSL